jgi:hypothetical protein
MPERRKAAAAGILGAGAGLAAGLALAGGKAKVAPKIPEEDHEAILADTYYIKTAIEKLADKIDNLVEVLTPAPPKHPDLPPYNVYTHYLDTEHTQANAVEVNIPGDSLTFYTDGTYTGIYIRFDSKMNDAVPIAEFGNPYKYPYAGGFEKFYIENTAQSGKYLRIHIGREAGAEASVQITAAAPKVVFYDIASDKDTHFTGALNQYAKEDENLTNLLGNKIRITGITIEADQALDFWVMFWNKDTFDNTDLDLSTFIGMVELDLSTYGQRVGGSGQYYMSLEKVDLDCEDKDATNELHCSLFNASATAKNAGATGEVKLVFRYQLMG